MTADVFITEFVQHIANDDPTIINNKALDGTHYIQIIGEPGKTITATVYVDYAGKLLLENAQKSGNLLRFTSFGVTDYGRLTSLSFDHHGRDHYEVEIVAAGETSA